MVIRWGHYLVPGRHNGDNDPICLDFTATFLIAV
jgi:hypothetical protein